MTVFLRAGFGLVLRVDHERWGQTGEYLRDLALSAGHARSRERFLALHNYTAEMEPDQEQGYCESCSTNTVVSALVLAGLI